MIMKNFHEKTSASKLCEKIFKENNLVFSSQHQNRLDEILEKYYNDEDFIIKGIRKSERCFKTTTAKKPDRIAFGFFNYLDTVLKNESEEPPAQAFYKLCNCIEGTSQFKNMEIAEIDRFVFDLENELIRFFGENQTCKIIDDVCKNLYRLKNFDSIKNHALVMGTWLKMVDLQETPS